MGNVRAQAMMLNRCDSTDTKAMLISTKGEDSIPPLTDVEIVIVKDR